MSHVDSKINWSIGPIKFAKFEEDIQTALALSLESAALEEFRKNKTTNLSRPGKTFEMEFPYSVFKVIIYGPI